MARGKGLGTSWAGAIVWAAVCGLCACGGGGGGGDSSSKPTISGTYELSATAEVGVSGSLRAVVTGIDGTPRCTLDSGGVPPGMVFATDCSLQGTPTQAGDFLSTLNFTVPGYDGTATVHVTVRVGGPLLSLGNSPLPMTLGQAIEPAPLLAVAALAPFAAQAGDVRQFAIVSGTLPPGLSLDASTGIVSGTPTDIGTFTAIVSGTLTRAGQTFTLMASSDGQKSDSTTIPLRLTVGGPASILNYGSGSTMITTGVAPLTLIPSILPAPPGQATTHFMANAALPAGLALDAVTGVIAGTPIAPGIYSLDVTATVTLPSGGSYVVPINGHWQIQVNGIYPLYEFASNGSRSASGSSVGHVLSRGSTVTVAPGTVSSGLAGDTYRFELAPDSLGNRAPAWVSVDTVTGIVTASPPADIPGLDAQFSFGLNVVTQRGMNTITTPMNWTLLVR